MTADLLPASPRLIACSHGTRSAEGREQIAALVELVRDMVPGAQVEQAFVDVEQPEVDDVVAGAVQAGPVVVVPLLLSTGFHTKVDIARAVAPHEHAVATGTLGPHPLLADVLADRLAALPGGDAGRRPGDRVVLAASGSTDPAACADVERMRDLLADLIPSPVTIGYAAGAEPRIPEAVAAARAAGAGRVVAASYVLAPGHFATLVAGAGADLVSAPLGADARVAEVIAERYHGAYAPV